MPLPTVQFSIPVKVKSEANLREHHMAKYRRSKAQKNAAYLMTVTEAKPYREPKTEITVAMVRVYGNRGKRMDSDNLARSMKACRDGIANGLCIDDGSELIDWQYAQRKGTEDKVEVLIAEHARRNWVREMAGGGQ